MAQVPFEIYILHYCEWLTVQCYQLYSQLLLHQSCLCIHFLTLFMPLSP